MSTVFSRRNLLIGAGVLAVAGTSTYFLTKGPGLNTGNKLENPVELKSESGLLEVTLTAAPLETSVDGKAVTMLAYNGSIPGPTLRVRPGDKVRLKLVNNFSEPTNLHTHGLFVDPNDNSDNPFIHVMNGDSFDYEFDIPAEQVEGTNWYHPHLHGKVANQVFGGLYGTIVVESDQSPLATEERVLVISDASFNQDGSLKAPNMMDLMMGREGDSVMVNGLVNPTGEAKSGALERWRIVNACVARYLSLQVAGGTATLLGYDGHQIAKPGEFDSFVLAPGNRADVLVAIKDSKVSLNYTTVAHPDAGMMGMSSQTFDNYALFTLNASGTADPLSPPTSQQTLPDLRDLSVTGKRQFVLAMPNHAMAMESATMEGMFTINGEAFSMDKVNTTVSNDTVEEWTIVNNSTMQHPFHLHIWPMQVLSIDDQQLDPVLYQDVVTVPANGKAVVRVNFHTHTGKTLYHCHILDHEDQGMMGVIESA
jgi:FtsP/CotA-like multicopper oxidase with cupredoxin domain